MTSVSAREGSGEGTAHGIIAVKTVGNSAIRRRRWSLAILAAVLLGGGCNAFRRTGPDDAPEFNPPRVVSVTVQYRQPQGCLNVATTCDEPVVFFGSATVVQVPDAR